MLQFFKRILTHKEITLEVHGMFWRGIPEEISAGTSREISEEYFEKYHEVVSESNI